MSILLLDIETFPSTVNVWQLYKANALEVVAHTRICSYSYKWLGGTSGTRALSDLPKYKPQFRDDTQLVKELWHLVDKAEIVIAHFGDGFDVPTIKAAFSRAGLQPPTPFKTIDTKKVSSKLFYFGGAYTLDHICQYLGLGAKMPTGGYDLWKQCMAGDQAAWARMKKYNAHDVTLLEKLYLHIRPWITDHPNTYPDRSCPKCGSQLLQSRGTTRTSTRTYTRYQCQSCGGWSRSTNSVAKVTITNAQ